MAPPGLATSSCDANVPGLAAQETDGDGSDPHTAWRSARRELLLLHDPVLVSANGFP